MKKKQYKLLEPSVLRKKWFEHFYFKYANLFKSSYRCDELQEQEQDYILEQFWLGSGVAAFNLINPETRTPLTSLIGFQQFVEHKWNLYNYPIMCRLLNPRNSKNVPDDRDLEVNKEVVLGWSNKAHISVYQMIEPLIYALVDLKMTENTNLTLQKLPFLVPVDEVDKERKKDIIENILNDDIAVFANLTDINTLKVLPTPAPYIVDKINTQEVNIENQILTIIGIDNIGSIEKKERVNTDEANSNNELINDHSENFLQCLTKWSDRIKEVLGFEMNWYAVASPATATGEEDEFVDEKGGDDNDVSRND